MKKFEKTGPSGREPTDAELHVLEAEVDGAEDTATPELASTAVHFAKLGLDEFAYVRRAVIDDVPVWNIYSAMGDQIGVAPTLEQAWGAIVQNDLQPVHVQ